MPKRRPYKLPASLRIGPFTYQVESLPKPAAIEEGVYGDCDLDNNHIRIAAGMSAPRRAETLLHESFHAMFNASSLKGTRAIERHEEAIVSALSNTMAQFMRDNPAAVRGIIDALTG